MLTTRGTQVAISFCLGVSFIVLDDDVQFSFRSMAEGGHSCVI
jgi:hypothetical protein